MSCEEYYILIDMLSDQDRLTTLHDDSAMLFDSLAIHDSVHVAASNELKLGRVFSVGYVTAKEDNDHVCWFHRLRTNAKITERCYAQFTMVQDHETPISEDDLVSSTSHLRKTGITWHG